MKNVLAFLAGAAVTAIGWWIYGWDFNERSAEAAVCYVTILSSGCCGILMLKIFDGTLA